MRKISGAANIVTYDGFHMVEDDEKIGGDNLSLIVNVIGKC